MRMQLEREPLSSIDLDVAGEPPALPESAPTMQDARWVTGDELCFMISVLPLLPSYANRFTLYKSVRSRATRKLNLFDKSFITYLPIFRAA